MDQSRRAPAGSAARRARADHILDVTAELLQAHGYRRVSIDDVAARAQIGKGTIYLHWRSREALFWAALQRETIRLLDDVAGRLAEEAELALPHRLMPAIFIEVMRRPLVRAVLLADAEVLGALAADDSVATAQRELRGQPDYLELLAARGLLNPELSAVTAGQILGSVMRGFFAETDAGEATGASGARLGEEHGGLSLDQRADLLGVVMRKVLERDAPPAAGAVSGLRDAVVQLFAGITATQQAQLERAY